MPPFSINDVRETFTSDVSSFLGKIEDGARLLSSAPLFQVPLSPHEPLWQGQPTFEAIAEFGHAIAGTTGLVGADSLSTSAHAMQDLALRGHAAFADLERCIATARRAAELCSDGARRMRSMLELELAGRASEAVWESIEWVELVRDAQTEDVADDTAREAEPVAADETRDAGRGSPGSPTAAATDPAQEAAQDQARSLQAPANEFSFEDMPDATAEVAPALNEELRQIFEEEARAAVGNIDSEISALAADPASLGTAGNLERLFHTLKGAAATVGLANVSEAAGALQQRMEWIVEGGAAVPADFAEELLGDVNEMLRLAGLPPIAASSSASKNTEPEHERGHEDEATREARVYFIEEARAALGEVSGAVPALSEPDAEVANQARASLSRLFHRMKGSALIVGEAEIGEESERLQHLMDASDTKAVQAVAEVEMWLALVKSRLGSALPAAEAGRAASPASIRQAVEITTNEELRDTFFQECSELMELIDRDLLGLEESHEPKNALGELMGRLHTLKGVINTVGLTPSGELLHEAEDLLEHLLAAPILPPMRAVATLLFGVQGDLRKNLRQSKDGYVEVDLPRLKARVARLLAGPKGGGEDMPGASLPGLSVGDRTAGQLSDAGASVHSIHSARSVVGGPSDTGRGESTGSSDDALGRRYIRVATDRLDALMNLAGELVVSRSRLLSRVGALRSVQQEIGFGHRRLVEAVETFSEEHEFSLVKGRGRSKAAPAPTTKAVAAVDVTAAPSARSGGGEQGAWESFSELELDRYEDVHILSRRLTEMTGDFSEMNGQLGRHLAAFNDDSEVFGRIVSGIQGEVTRARMVPLDQLFTRLRLPVRDAATRDKKEVRVTVSGAEVNIDKTIADALFQPMLHLVRNAVVHGFEEANVRERAGKAPLGTIDLRARQESGQIVVEVNDDGAGLDLERLKARGVAMGLIGAETPLSDPAVRDLVFASGLSTRDRAGAVSGRGVGCEVVRRVVERLNGTIRVDSKPGRGTTFIVTLPVTLAITKALIVRHGNRTFAVPLHFAERILDPQEANLMESAGLHRIKIEGGYLAVNRLEQYFRAGSPTVPTGPVLVLRVGPSRMVLQVDALLGQEEIVVKNLGNILTGHPVFAGVTVRGSGELALILDIPALVQGRQIKVESETSGRSASRTSGGISGETFAPASSTQASSQQGTPHESQGSPSVPSSAPDATPDRPLRVLFIDDSLSVRKFAQLALTGLGVEVTLAVDGLDGLAKVREGNFDMVFTDLEMPRMHGFDLIRQLRFLPAYRDLPIAVITSRSSSKHEQQARELGATEYLSKPFTAQGLEVVLKRWGRSKARAATRGSAGKREVS